MALCYVNYLPFIFKGIKFFIQKIMHAELIPMKILLNEINSPKVINPRL